MAVLSLLLSREMAYSLLVLVSSWLLYAAWEALKTLWWRPRRIRKVFEAQGIPCLDRKSFLSGNMREFVGVTSAARSKPMPQLSHDIVPRILPHLLHWSKLYGDYFVFWLGSEARIYIREPEQAKEILNNKFGHYLKITARPETRDLVGSGLITAEGKQWARHRRIMNPAFFLDKLKAMIPTIATCTASMMESWEAQVEKGVIDMHDSFEKLTADIIAHTAFGSSYAEGKQVFEMQQEQQILFYRLLRSIYIPGLQFLPTATNRYRWKLNSRIVSILSQLIEKRMESEKSGEQDGYGHDLLGLMMAANKGQLQGNDKNLSMGLDEMIDECKTFFFAGHETTSALLTWTCLLLASNPEWQERLREEVYAVCGTKGLPTGESINQLKLVGLVLNESLRLYPPGVELARKPGSDMLLGGKTLIPAGTVIMMPVIMWHHDPRFWGPDAHEFRPERFATSASSSSAAFMPFSMGPRNCIGQTFAMLEAKVVLSCVLQHYRFRLSPTYQHAPTTIFAMHPQFGMPMLLEKLTS